ncbi:MAG: DNA polymerase I [Pyrinomonadaceae bacterium]
MIGEPSREGSLMVARLDSWVAHGSIPARWLNSAASPSKSKRNFPMPDLWCDLESFSPISLKTHGAARYAEDAEVIIFTWALDDDPVSIWDATRESTPPALLVEALHDERNAVWFQNGDKFDWIVLKHALPWAYEAVPLERRRDTMVQAYCHGLPGGLEMMGDALGLDVDKTKLKSGRRLIHLFCKPQRDGGRNDSKSHPEEWAEFCEYAKQDIVAMRECHRRMPSWNYKGKQLDLWFLDQRINARGMFMDQDLARAAVRASEISKTELKARTVEATDGEVDSATQVDAMLAHILSVYGIDLPDMQKATIERRANDPSIPPELRELLLIRLESAKTSVAKYTALLNSVNTDGRLRGCMQYRGAARTGRVGHRVFQPGNMPRPTMKAAEIEWAIEMLKLDAAQLVYENVMKLCSNAIRGSIIAAPGKKLVVADLANIEGRFAAWLAGEAWKLQAFRDYDAGTGADLYLLSYAKAFNVPVEDVPKKGDERQIGKVMELMLQYQGGVGAFLTGAATYRIDLKKMAEQVFDTLPEWAVKEAEGFLEWLYEDARDAYAKALVQAKERVDSLLITAEDAAVELDAQTVRRDARMLKARHGLDEKTFIVCDALKRLWRTAHPKISSYWRELEDTIKEAIANKGVTFEARKLKVRCDGAWLRVALPSGRALCYPKPMVDAVVGKKHYPGISYMGIDQYTRKWQRITSYGGKFFENVTQAAACDQLLECGLPIEAAGFDPILTVHDEYVCEAPADRDDLNDDMLGDLMCSNLGWNEGLPLAAAGYSGHRYRKDD